MKKNIKLVHPWDCWLANCEIQTTKALRFFLKHINHWGNPTPLQISKLISQDFIFFEELNWFLDIDVCDLFWSRSCFVFETVFVRLFACLLFIYLFFSPWYITISIGECKLSKFSMPFVMKTSLDLTASYIITCRWEEWSFLISFCNVTLRSIDLLPFTPSG